jgi:hypothetical protein
MSTIVARRPTQYLLVILLWVLRVLLGYVSPFCSDIIHATLLEHPRGAGEGGWCSPRPLTPSHPTPSSSSWRPGCSCVCLCLKFLQFLVSKLPVIDNFTHFDYIIPFRIFQCYSDSFLATTNKLFLCKWFVLNCIVKVRVLGARHLQNSLFGRKNFFKSEVNRLKKIKLDFMGTVLARVGRS